MERLWAFLSADERNLLIGALPASDRAALSEVLERTPLALGAVLHEPEHDIDHVYFPDSGVVSLLQPTDGRGTEVALAGREALVGLAVCLDMPAATTRAVVQVPGSARRVPATIFRELLEERPALGRTIRRYTYAYLAQVTQNAACRAHHSVEQQCARWLLATRDLLDEDDFPLKHESLAEMLGVRRASVTVVLGLMRRAGYIQYSRGRIAILDRAGLESAACGCYRANRQVLRRALLPLLEESRHAFTAADLAPSRHGSSRQALPRVIRTDRQRAEAVSLIHEARTLLEAAQRIVVPAKPHPEDD